MTRLSVSARTPATAREHASLECLMRSPLYQVRRILRVTQTHWELPLAKGKRAAREARRLLSPPRPGAIALLAGSA